MSVLLLTGAIDLRKYNVPFTYLIDYKDRLQQYINGIEYAIDNYTTINKIVFCENTSFIFDYSFLAKKSKGKELEYLTFEGNYDQIQKLGKGFGEGEIIKYALDHSRLLKSESSFYKLTGRLIIKNMDQLIKATTSGNAFIFKQKEISDRPENYIETYLYKVETALYKQYLLDAYCSSNDNIHKYLEHVFYDKLHGLTLRGFKIQPIVSGIVGSTGESYAADSKRSKIENFYFAVGIYNLKKTFPEILFAKVWVQLLNFKRLIGIKNTK